MLLYKSLKDHYKKDLKSPALLYMGKSVSYGTLFDSIDDAAARLSSFVSAGDVVTICMPNTPECVYCFYALNRLGAIAHMVHPLAPFNQLKKFMAAAKSKALITLSINLEKYASLAADYPIISIHPARSLNGLLRFAFNLKVKPYKGDMTNITDYNALKRGELPSEPTRDSGTTGVYLHSGGTGGEPKIIELSDDSINALANRGLEALCLKDGRGMYMLGALPMFHGFGLAMCIHATLTYGAVSVLMPKFDPQKTVKLIKKNKMHLMIGVPNLFRALLKQKDFNGDMLKNIYVGFVGGDCAPQDLLDEFNGRMESAGAHGRLFEGYGLTETVTVCAVNNYDYNRRGSMGHMLSDLDALILDPDSDTPLEVGEKGEIAIAGDTLMVGYLDNQEENERVFANVNGKRYVRSGDFGYLDADGFLYFIQRLKRIIKISGISVYPKEIESAALEIPGVTGACAVEYKDGGKTRIALYLTGAPQDAESVKRKIENDLSRYAVPTIVETIDAIPVTPVMKADTIALTARAEGRSK
ncbi:MAG: acyl--CoA ligase [Clostridiales bacterium]|nr:acyl--CoA ligase [Clostridiales bacterium]